MKKFSRSNRMFKNVSKVIPLATQTFSKSYYMYVKGQSPLFITKAEGTYVWDVDGNKYLDFVNGLLPVILGHRYSAVDKAIARQMKNGILFSLPSPLEYELSKALVDLIPCAEMVRFGKNGSDVTTGAIRLARAVTGRELVAICGYHGWHDWYIGTTTRDLGVPESTKKLSFRFTYNDISSLAKLFKQHKNKFAAVIMEPMNFVVPQNNFLQKVKDLAHQNGALLIFDEVITGFRFNLGGAQKLFGVTPDLATFGKSMANGMPISALVGKRKYMKLVTEIFYSFTNSGETLSLAAALATIKEIKEKKVIDYIWRLGEYLQTEATKLTVKYGLSDVIEFPGLPAWVVTIVRSGRGYSDLQIKSYIQQELIQGGILCNFQHNISFSHTKADIDKLLASYDKIFARLKNLLETKQLAKHIRGGLITNTFKVR